MRERRKSKKKNNHNRWDDVMQCLPPHGMSRSQGETLKMGSYPIIDCKQLTDLNVINIFINYWLINTTIISHLIGQWMKWMKNEQIKEWVTLGHVGFKMYILKKTKQFGEC